MEEKKPYLPENNYNEKSRIKHIIAVASGKGGVGKSFTSSFLAVKLARKGYKVGILDADITGPSIPFSFNLKGPVDSTGESFFYPLKSKKYSIEVMSSNLLVPNESDPLVWRGPMVASLIEQFYRDVIWDVDYLIVDLAPGTSDVSLTVFQSMNIDAAILVSTPQSLVSLIVDKSMNMASLLNVPIIALVENMAYVKCPKCDERIDIYGKIDKSILKKHNIPILEEIPFDDNISSFVDSGKIEELEAPYLDNIVDELVKLDSKTGKKN